LQSTSAPPMKIRSLRHSDADPTPAPGFRSPASAPACRSRWSIPSRTAASGRGSRSLVLLHQQKQCRTPLFPLQGNPRLPGVPYLARPLRFATNPLGADAATTTPLQDTVLNIADL
jgi:hypothetical protein